MRNSAFIRNLLLLLAIASPSLLIAQFQAPTDQELKMTPDPKAPGADAVYLYREFEVDDSNGHYFDEKTPAQDQWCQSCPSTGSRHYYDRLKVLTEKGKAAATVTIPYDGGEFTIAEFEGRTIHPDGTVIPLTVTPSDLMEYKKKNPWTYTFVFTMPSVEVGSILEYRLNLLYNNMHSTPTWNVQQPYFIHKEHYSFHPYLAPQLAQYFKNGRGQLQDHLLYVARIGEGKVNHIETVPERYTLDLTDVPAVPDVEWMPPLNLIKWNVRFFYTTGISGDAFWEDAGKQWAKAVDEYTNPSADLKKAAGEIVAPGDSDAQKAAKLYAAVMKLENADFTNKPYDATLKNNNADDVWRQQRGYANDIARLYIAMARAVDLQVWPMQVVDRDRAFFDPSTLDVGQLNDYIAIVNLGGKEVYLDPGQKMCPFGQLQWKHTFAAGLRLSADKDAVRATTPGGSYKAAVVRRVADLAIDPQGNVKGTVGVAMIGPDALYWRQMALSKDQNEVKNQFKWAMQDYMPQGVQADVDHFQGLDDPNANFVAMVQVSGNLGAPSGNKFALPGLFFESRAKEPFVAETSRSLPVDVHFGKIEEDSVTYHLPPGFTVATAPQPANISWPGHALLGIGVHPAADSVNVQRSLVYDFALLDSKDYPALHDFYVKVAAADKQPLVLNASSSGN